MGFRSQADLVLSLLRTSSKVNVTFGQYFQFRVLGGGKECVAVGNREWLYTAPGSQNGTTE